MAGWGQVGKDVGLGMLGGGVIPGLMSAGQGKYGSGIQDFLFGNDSRFNDQQKPYYGQALQEGFGLSNNPLYQQGAQQAQQNLNSNHEDYFGPLIQQFQESTAPRLAAQFAGAGNNRSSSGVGNAIGGGLRGLGQDLASQYATMKQSALQQALQYAQAPGQQSMNAVTSLLGPFQQAPSQGALGGLLTAAGSIAGSPWGPVGSGVGATIGQGVGSGISSMFRRG